MHFPAGKTAVKQTLDSKESLHFLSPGFWSGLADHLRSSHDVQMNGWARPSQRQSYNRIMIPETNSCVLANSSRQLLIAASLISTVFISEVLWYRNMTCWGWLGWNTFIFTPRSFCMVPAVGRFILGGAVSLIAWNTSKVCLNKQWESNFIE